MKGSFIALLCLGAGLSSGCTYEGLRMQERRDCGAMPQTQAERCFARTEMTEHEYELEREKIKNSGGERSSGDKVDLDPRYERWIP